MRLKRSFYDSEDTGLTKRLVGELRSATMKDSAMPKASNDTMICGVYSGFIRNLTGYNSSPKANAPRRYEQR